MSPFQRLSVILFLFLSSCVQQDLFEQHTGFSNHQWSRGNIIKGEVEIKDTAALYNLYLVIRHTDAYKYNNIWLKFYFNGIADSTTSQLLELSLGNDDAGWEGVGMNDIIEVRKRITPRPVRFKKPGRYQYGITQEMRDNPLDNIMSIGLRVAQAP